MIDATKLKNGATFMDQNEPYKVIKYTHTHLSRGAGNVKLKVRNLRTGAVTNKAYKGNDRVEEADLTTKNLQYLYKEGGDYIFMDSSDFTQVNMTNDILGDQASFLKEGDEYQVGFWTNPRTSDEEPLDVNFPPKINLKVKEASPGVKGDTQGAATKDAILENGLKVRVPLFINAGDEVRVDTRSGEYVERAS